MNSLLKRNIVANFIGRFWSAGLNLALIPVYARILGTEALGLIAFNALLFQLFNLMDVGVTATITREMAMRTNNTADANSDLDSTTVAVSLEHSQETRNLVRTVEVFYWPIALLIGLVVWVMAPTIADHWLQEPRSLSSDDVRQSVIMMGLSMAALWPYTLYEGALIGLQRQVILNTIIIATASLRGFGSLVVILVHPSVRAFFMWQIAASSLTTVSACAALWGSLPAAPIRPRFQVDTLRLLWRFAISMAGITMLEFTLVYMDKLVLSRSVSLEEFGYYALAGSAAGAIFSIFAPLYSAFYPRLVQAVRAGSQAELRGIYHNACRWMGLAILPVAVTLAVYARPVMLLWTRSSLTADRTAHFVTLLAIGFGLFGLIHIPLGMMRARGLTRYLLVHDLTAVLVALPVMIAAVRCTGAAGACWAWIGINLGWALVMVPVMHSRLLFGEYGRWLGRDVGLPSVVVLSVALAARSLIPPPASTVGQLVMVLGVGFVALICCGLVTFPPSTWLRLSATA